MRHFKHSQHHGHDHDRHHHKKDRKYGRHHHFKHMELWNRRSSHSQSDSELSDMSRQNEDVQEHIGNIVRAFFHRRHHWGRGRGCCEQDPASAEGPSLSSSPENHGDLTAGWRRRRRHHHSNYHGGRRGHESQGRTTDGESNSNPEGKEKDETNHHHRMNHHGCGHRFWRGRDQGRSTEDGESSSEAKENEDGCHKKKMKHHYGRRGYWHDHRHGKGKYMFKAWKRHGPGYCVAFIDASTMTDDIEDTEQSPNPEVSDKAQPMENAETNQEANQGPASPAIQEVAENLRKSSLE